MKKIALWGFGKCYNLMFNTIKYLELTGQLKISAIIATDAYMDTLDGYKVVKPQMINQIEFEYIFVMSDVSYNEIIQSAVNDYNIPRRKLVSYRALQVPHINLDDYFELYESRISIISNNCWGGTIYNALGLECLSPFKNLFLTDKDYLKVISDLEAYMKITPVLDRFEIEPRIAIKYPVLKLGDVDIHCNHTTDARKAIEDWERRKKKINYSNLYLEMFTEDKLCAENFVNITKGYPSICFVPWDTKEDRLMTLALAPRQKEFYEAVNDNGSMRTYGHKYNLVDILKGKRTFRY